MSGLARLPTRARAKLAGIEQRADDLAALSNAAMQAVEHVNVRLARVQDRRPRNDEEMKAMLAEVEVIETEAASKRAVFETRRQKSHAARQLVSQLRTFIDRDHGSATFEHMEPPQVEVAGDGAAAVVARLRQQLVNLHVELANISRAPLTVDELKALARDQIMKMAASAKPTIAIERGNFEMTFAKPDAWTPGIGANVAASQMAWLHTEQMISAVERQIDAMAINGVSADERADRIGNRFNASDFSSK